MPVESEPLELFIQICDQMDQTIVNPTFYVFAHQNKEAKYFVTTWVKLSTKKTP